MALRILGFLCLLVLVAGAEEGKASEQPKTQAPVPSSSSLIVASAGKAELWNGNGDVAEAGGFLKAADVCMPAPNTPSSASQVHARRTPSLSART